MNNSCNTPSQFPHAWSKDALLTKAQKYCEEMLQYPKDDWRFAFWSSLTLELLGRAALAQINPILLADTKDWNNLLYALGHQPKANKFLPRSIDISAVFSRLEEILKDFTPELKGFAISHMQERNEELHSGNNPFNVIAKQNWLPNFYGTLKVLLESMNYDLDLLLGEDEAKAALQIIRAARDEQAKAVQKSLNAYQTIWESKTNAEQNTLREQASIWASRHDGHRVKCPACDSDALVEGTPIAAPRQSIELESDQITETQEYLPAKFECVACGMKLSGLSHLSACGLGNPYKATFTYDIAEYYDEYAYYEPDFNEP